MRSERLRKVTTVTTVALVGVIVLFTLLVSPAQGDPAGRLFPGTIPFLGAETGYDSCVGGISCEDGHALAFIALATSLTVQVLAGKRGARLLAGAIGVLILLAAFATGDELVQRWIGRDASIDDWLADVSGAVLGTVLGAQIARVLAQE